MNLGSGISLMWQLGQTSAKAEAVSAERSARSAAPALQLTARERDVLHWLAYGKTDRDIAAILLISPRTVHKHLQHIYDKLGVETRTAAVMRTLAVLR